MCQSKINIPTKTKLIILHNFYNRDLLPNATLPPSLDHEYAQWQDRDIVTWDMCPDTPIKSPWGSMALENEFGGLAWSSCSPSKQDEDLRQCMFCSKYGDDLENVR